MKDEITSHSVHLICGQRPKHKGRVARGCVPTTNHRVHIANKLKDLLSQLGLNISEYRGQRYDRPSNMHTYQPPMMELLDTQHKIA